MEWRRKTHKESGKLDAVEDVKALGQTELVSREAETPTKGSNVKIQTSDKKPDGNDSEVARLVSSDSESKVTAESLAVKTYSTLDTTAAVTEDQYSSDNDTDNSSHCSYCTSEYTDSSSDTASTDEELAQTDHEEGTHSPGQVFHARNESETANPEQFPGCSPMFAPRWECSTKANSGGNTLRKAASDIILQVPADAVKKESEVVVSTAVCADTARIHRKLKLREDEEIVSPLVEYTVGKAFRFERPVIIKLPHWLPADFDSDYVRVYHAEQNATGEMITTAIQQRPGTEDDSPTSADTVCTVREDRLDSGQDAEPRQSDVATEIPEENAMALQDTDNMHFKVTEKYILISTVHFCAFFCVYCKKTMKKHLYVSGTASRPYPGWVDINVCLWDGRLKVEDCRHVSVSSFSYVL